MALVPTPAEIEDEGVKDRLPVAAGLAVGLVWAKIVEQLQNPQNTTAATCLRCSRTPQSVAINVSSFPFPAGACMPSTPSNYLWATLWDANAGTMSVQRTSPVLNASEVLAKAAVGCATRANSYSIRKSPLWTQVRRPTSGCALAHDLVATRQPFDLGAPTRDRADHDGMSPITSQ